MLEHINNILCDLKFELVNYFDDIVARIINMVEKISNDRYLISAYIKDKSDDDLTPYGREVKKNYGRMVSLLDELKSIRKVKMERYFLN
jgi:Mg2+ and Co2+ transporter CorA